jgi:phage shock protein C
MKKLYRSAKNRILGGVCGGIGEFLNVDPTIIRLIWILFSFNGVGLIFYLLAWLIIPRNPNHKWK